MSFLYPIVSDLTGSLNSGSYLNKTDYELFVNGTELDFWYGTSEKDAIELSVYDLDDNLVYWNPIDVVGEYKHSVLTFYDSKNIPVSYNYKQFVFDRPLYKTEKVLVEPLADLSSSNLPPGNYKISYEFTRYLAGSPTNPLVIKEISPNRTELKLIPARSSSVSYESFCVNKIPLDDISPLYLTLSRNCPYSTLFENSKLNNQNQINLIKNLFFISSDGKFVEFLKTIYEDYIKYTNNPPNDVSSYTRIQGIRTYFSNFLVSNTNKVYSFDDIKLTFEKFTKDRLELLFSNFKSDQYFPAKQYLFNLFVVDFFLVIHKSLQSKYENKYRSPLKNVLSYGEGQYIPILSNAYIDEKQFDSDPLTLLIKLQSPINDDISIKSNVWISNAGMIPVFFNAIIKEGRLGKTIKISAPDFTAISKNSSLTNVNKFYSNEDLQNSSLNDNLVGISKKINELNVDYTNLIDFVVFSSAGLRHDIFKNKMMSLSNIQTSLTTLETNYSSSGYSYPYYTSEKDTLETQESDVLKSFDGWESFLYKTGYYDYTPSSRTFSSQSFVDEMDIKVAQYDKVNRDSLVNNTPEHIILDSENDDYLIFLSMVGHYFDNLYLYIKSLPIERSAENTNTFSKNILQQMLQSFGWNLDTSLENINITDNFLDADLDSTDNISSNDRTRQMWNRILNTLLQIYKTKGTEECIKMVLACYGIPSTMLSIKEYGGIDYENTGKTSYTIEEKLFMLTFKGVGEFVYLPFFPTNRTVEFKVSLDPNRDYTLFEKIPLAVKYNTQLTSSVDWTLGVFKEKGQYLGRAYFDIFTGSMVSIVSDSIPIFNGEIFNIMIRKNDPDSLFELNPIIDLVPAKYDLKVQRKEDERIIFSSSNSYNFTQSFNCAFENQGFLFFGNYQTSSGFVGMLDKIMVWDVPISDFTFDDHCNNISSYSYTGSFIPHEVLYFRMSYDYPKDFSATNPFIVVNANEHFSSSVWAYAWNFGIQSYSSSIDNCITSSHSVFPYQFTEMPYNQTFTISSYGPNKFKNRKIQNVDLELAARLDPNERSSYSPNRFVTPDSNQIGLFADPNEYKNKDIFRYFGDYGLTQLIAEPLQMFDDKYYPLKSIRDQYNESGNKRILYTELFTLYKFYFDKSIFETIKQLIPARNNILTGILIEPTVLERPKYQYKKIGTETGVSYTSSVVLNLTASSAEINSPTLVMGDSIFSAGTIKGDFVSVDFQLDKNLFSNQLYENVPFYLSDGPYQSNDPLYIQFLALKNRLTFVSSGWIKRYPNSKELGIVEQHPDWPIPAQDFGPLGTKYNPYTAPSSAFINGFFKFSGILPGFYLTGSGYYYLKQCYFYNQVNDKNFESLDNLNKSVQSTINLGSVRLPTFNFHVTTRDGIINDIDNPEELGVFCNDAGKIIEPVFSGSNSRYMLKEWIKDNTYVTIGDYSKPQTVVSQSLYFYTTQIWEDSDYASLVHTQPINTSNLYFEAFGGYSRNHLNHKRISFSNEAKPMVESSYNDFGRFVKSRQTIDTTIDETGLNDRTLPVQTINVSNINVIKTTNVLS